MATAFMHIGTQYYGVEIAPTTGNMGATAVTIFGNQTLPGHSDSVLRWFEIEPGVDQTAGITFYYRDAEENEQDAANVYHYNGSGWELESLDSRDSSGVENNWIRVTGVNEYSPFILANNNPTAILLARFEAFPNGSDVRLEWETASELDALGFNLYRSTSSNGPRDLVNVGLIPVYNPGGVMGSTYQFIDNAAGFGTTYYWLEDVDIHNTTTLHGPITVTRDAITQVTVQDWSATHGNLGWLIPAVILASAALLFVRARLNTYQTVRTRRE